MEPKPIRVLVVDDLAFMRFSITRRLNQTPGILVVGAAHDGQQALDMIPNADPDVITLDVEMPRMDGLSTLRAIMDKYPRPVIMLSSLTHEGTCETIKALTWGAVDFIAKPAAKANIQAVMDEVVVKIQRAARARVYALSGSTRQTPGPKPDPITSRLSFDKSPFTFRKAEKLLIIGASTGGLARSSTLVPNLPVDLPAAILIVQHMPVGFTRSLAERLDSLSPMAIKEAAPGDLLGTGRALVAPGGFHMTVEGDSTVSLNTNPPVHGVRPALDVTLLSAVQKFGSAIVSVILTGMGSDGTNGAALIHSTGGYVIAEDEASCVVWGMPRSVIEAGAANEIQPLEAIAASIVEAVCNKIPAKAH